MHKLVKYLEKEKVLNLINEMFLDLQKQRDFELKDCDAEFYGKEEILIELKENLSKMKSTLL